MYCGDRWKRPHAARGGDYVWLPITFTQKDSVVINYYQDWELDPDRGVWRTIDNRRNLALNKTATASSVNGSNVANNVTNPSTYENYLNTKWVSAASDPQWITVDLGSSMPVNRVILKWDSTYAKSFKIQVSTDNAEWTDVFSTTKAGARSVTDETFETRDARYVRMYGTQRGSTTGGYSLFDFMVLNDSLTVPVNESVKTSVANKIALHCVKDAVSYNIPNSSPVRLEVLDIRGKLVAVLDVGSRIAGNHTVSIPGSLSRGMYFIRLKAGLTNVSVKYIN